MSLELDLNKYRHCLSTLDYFIKEAPHLPIDRLAAEFSAIYGVPVTAVHYYAQELNGPNDVSREAIIRLTESYKYTEIVGLCTLPKPPIA